MPRIEDKQERVKQVEGFAVVAEWSTNTSQNLNEAAVTK